MTDNTIAGHCIGGSGCSFYIVGFDWQMNSYKITIEDTVVEAFIILHYCSLGPLLSAKVGIGMWCKHGSPFLLVWFFSDPFSVKQSVFWRCGNPTHKIYFLHTSPHWYIWQLMKNHWPFILTVFSNLCKTFLGWEVDWWMLNWRPVYQNTN